MLIIGWKCSCAAIGSKSCLYCFCGMGLMGRSGGAGLELSLGSCWGLICWIIGCAGTVFGGEEGYGLGCCW